jgi:long-subunit acyl-CoA synthetase (AMP-forming)
MASAAKPVTPARPRALQAATLCEAFQITAEESAAQVALRTKGDATSITWGEYADRVRSVAAGLAALGVKRGDTFGLMLINRPEFHVVDAAAMHLGATCFSIYNTSAPGQIEYLLTDAGNAVMVTERAFLERVLAAKPNVPTLEHIVVIDGPAEGAVTLDEVEAGADPGFDLEAAWRAVEPSDVLCLIYTSGTTGPPKGVQLTHHNIVAETRALDALLPVAPNPRTVSYLPMAHLADRCLNHYLGMFHGHSITPCPDPRELFAYVVDTRPTFFGGVPRIWEKLKAALEAGIAAEPDEQKQQATRWAIDVGLRKVRAEQGGQEVPAELLEEHAKAEELVLSKLRERLGLEKVEFFVAGAAATPLEVLEFFHAIGVEILELWGMSETSAVATCNPPGAVRLGTVGPPLQGVEVKLGDDGEVMVRGEIVMTGYRNMPEKTAETFTDDGWLLTGDIGELDDAGYLKIVDRKKELIINAAGKNMSPVNIENHIKSASPLIGQAIAIGDGRPYNVALVVLDPDGAAGRSADDPEVQREVAAAVEQANAHLSRVEQIKKFKLLADEWPPGGDELTPTMKLKRKPIAEKYAGAIEELYSG